MAKSAKISISLPDGVLRRVDQRRRATRESRSEFFRRAVEELLRRQREEEAVREYVAGYVAEPESPREVEQAQGLASAVLAQESWE